MSADHNEPFRWLFGPWVLEGYSGRAAGALPATPPSLTLWRARQDKATGEYDYTRCTDRLTPHCPDFAPIIVALFKGETP